MIVITLAMLSLIALAGLALDVGHVVVNKSRLQATADAAALAAAKILNTTGSTTAATDAATSVFSLNAAKQPELSSVSGSVSRSVEYSATLVPFSPGTVPARYVRVTASGFSIVATLASVVGVSSFTIGAKAVAGPSPTIKTACNIAPVMVCGAPGASMYGYSVGQIAALKLSSGTTASDLGPGNYRLLSLGGTGADIVRQNLAGSYKNCATVDTTALTQPGVAAGPVAQGLNTRFNEYSGGGMDSGSYPPDAIITQPVGNNRLSCQTSSCSSIGTGPGGGTTVSNGSQYPGYSYEGMYQPRMKAGSYDIPPAPNGNGVPDRRVLAVPVGDCSVASGGRNDIPILGLACFFLLQDVNTGGADGQVFGEFLSNCQVNGKPGPTPSSGPGPFLIQLYHVDGSPQS